jgi:hypothetical protein
MKKYFFASILLLFFAGCSTLQIQTDYNEEFKFDSLSKFFVVYTKKDDGKDFSRDQIGRALAKYFKAKGYSSTQKSGADFYLTFHLDIQTKSQVETNYETMGLYPARGYGRRLTPDSVMVRPVAPNPYRSSLNNTSTTRVSTQTYEYKEGRLIVEVIDVKSNNVVWQGIAKDELSDLSTPEEKSAYVNMILDSLLKDFPTKK